MRLIQIRTPVISENKFPFLDASDEQEKGKEVLLAIAFTVKIKFHDLKKLYVWLAAEHCIY